MERKAIELAKKTLVVSMPAKWVKENNVLKGQTLEVLEDKNKLTISTNKNISFNKITIDLRNKQTFDQYTLAYLYQAGIDEIKVQFNSNKQFELITKKIPELMGYEIINQSQDFFEIKNVSSPLEKEFDNMFRRTFHILQEFADMSLSYIKEKNYEKLNSLLLLETSIDKFTDFCKRILNKKGYKEHEKTVFLYTIVRDLEKIADFYESIIREILTSKQELDDKTEKLFSRTNQFIKQFHELVFKFNEEKQTRFIEEKQEIKIFYKKILETKNLKNNYLAFNLISIIKNISNLYGPLYLTKQELNN